MATVVRGYRVRVFGRSREIMEDGLHYGSEQVHGIAQAHADSHRVPMVLEYVSEDGAVRLIRQFFPVAPRW